MIFFLLCYIKLNWILVSAPMLFKFASVSPFNRPLMLLLRTSFQCDLRLLLSSRLTDFHRFPPPSNCSFTTPRYHSKHGTENFIARAISSAPEMVKAIRVHELGGPEVCPYFLRFWFSIRLFSFCWAWIYRNSAKYLH